LVVWTWVAKVDCTVILCTGRVVTTNWVPNGVPGPIPGGSLGAEVVAVQLLTPHWFMLSLNESADRLRPL
jgi:hypothetical protein